MRSTLAGVAAIVVVWVALWGDLSWANVVSGALVALAVLWVGSGHHRPRSRRVAVVPAARYGLTFVRDLVVATAVVAQQVFWRTDRLRPAVLAVQLRSHDAGLLALVADSITLTPGTLTVHADDATATLWIHVLHLPPDGEAEVVEAVEGLERLGARALGVSLPDQPDGGRRGGAGGDQS